MLTLDSPRDSDVHTIADFAELLCLVTPDRVCSSDYLRDYIKDYADKQLGDDDLNDVFAQLGWRQKAFDIHYPFSLDAHGFVLQAAGEISADQSAYIFLLLCASLPFIHKEHRHSLTEAFERAALCAFRRLWPERGTAKAFGRNETEYLGAKWERMNRLGYDIGGQPMFTAETFRRGDSGDGGVDLVAWLDLDGHEKGNIPAALAQCACSRSEWPRKQLEISASRLTRHLRPSHPWMELIFIPQSFRNNQGRWAVDGEIGNAIVMDRLRLLSQLDVEGDWAVVDASDILSKFLDIRLELV